jgi:tetratricopeptide (TPR) repeat protein
MGARGVAFLRIAIGGLLLLATADLAPAQAQSPDLDDLYRRGVELYQAGRYADAVPIVEQFIKVAAATLGEESPTYASGLGDLAALDQALNRTAEAEDLFKRALDIREKTLGPDHPDVAKMLNSLEAGAEGLAGTVLWLKRAAAETEI